MMDYLNAAISVMLGLQVLTLTTLFNHQRRINRIEDDMYVDPKNPTSNPLTKQVADFRKDISDIKEKINCLEGKIETIINMLNDFKDGG